MKFLPIGSIVLLKDATKKIMTIGFMAIDKDEKLYDYIACPYPEGVVSSKQYLLFNHNQIEKIYYKGFLDEDGKTLNNKLLEINNLKGVNYGQK